MIDKLGFGKNLAWWGVAITYIGNAIGQVLGWGFFVSLIGLSMCVAGCRLWALGKGRSQWFMLWGILAPIGFLGVALLRNKGVEDGN